MWVCVNLRSGSVSGRKTCFHCPSQVHHERKEIKLQKDKGKKAKSKFAKEHTENFRRHEDLVLGK